MQADMTTKFHQMGVLLLLDPPPRLQFGIDNMSWQVGTKFKGIKVIPLGTHIITYSLETENYMFPINKFIFFGEDQEERIRVFRWNTKAERFVGLRGEEAEGYREGVKKYHFDCYLGPYPQENVEFWSCNTKYITKAVLDKLDPIQYYKDCQEQYQNPQTVKLHEQQPNIDSDSQTENDLQPTQPKDQPKRSQHGSSSEPTSSVSQNRDFGGNTYYSQIPRRLTQQSSHTSLINIDRTELLESALATEWPKNEMGVLGELQYSFVAFLIGQCLDAYQQWKKLMILLSSSERAFETRKNLMLEFVAVFYEQVRQFPEDFFYDELGKGNFLTSCLRNFRNYEMERTINKKALKRITKLLALVKEQFRYDGKEEMEEEEGPVVVGEDQSYY